jgi:hypothetical protein
LIHWLEADEEGFGVNIYKKTVNIIANILKKQLEIASLEEKFNKINFLARTLLDRTLQEFSDVCASSQTEIGRTTEIKNRIYTGDALPEAQRYYRTNPETSRFIEEEIDRMLKAGIIRLITPKM